MISVCILTKNQEMGIAEALEHFKIFADQIVVTDLNSTDKTREIAKELGAEVEPFLLTDDRSLARNAGLVRASHPWIMSLEENERLNLDDIQRLKALMVGTDSQALRLPIRTYSNDSGRGHFQPLTGPNSMAKDFKGFTESRGIRIFRNEPQIRFRGSVHETVEETIKGKILDSSVTIHRYEPAMPSLDQNPAELIQGLIRNVNANPDDWMSWFRLGLARMKAGDPLLAADALRRSLDIRATATGFSHLGAALTAAGEFADAERFFRFALKEFPTDHDLLHNYAVLKVHQKLWIEAADLFQTLLEHHPKSFSAYRGFGFALLNLNQVPQAKEQLLKSLEIFPDYEEGKIDLAIAHLSEGDVLKAKFLAESVMASNPQSARGYGLLMTIQANAQAGPV